MSHLGALGGPKKQLIKSPSKSPAKILPPERQADFFLGLLVNSVVKIYRATATVTAKEKFLAATGSLSLKNHSLALCVSYSGRQGRHAFSKQCPMKSMW